MNVGHVNDTATVAVNSMTFSAMLARFDGQVGAFAYLLFILLYFPCAAATAAIYRETNLAWTVFIAGWTTGLAYLWATLFYQLATFLQHPMSSIAWSGSLLFLFIFTLILLYLYGLKGKNNLNPPQILLEDK